MLLITLTDTPSFRFSTASMAGVDVASATGTSLPASSSMLSPSLSIHQLTPSSRLQIGLPSHACASGSGLIMGP